jgi:5-(carboxyamino)imidazole ribonucleotide synthase
MITLGIVGGGQLGRMICYSAHKRGLKTVILSDQSDCPAQDVCDKTIIGDYNNKKILDQFCESIDLATFEFENIPLETAEYIESKKKIYPFANVLKITQNRILEKNFLRENGVKTADFVEINNLDDLKIAITKFKKGILKTAIMGYDGKGQFVLDEKSEITKIYEQVKNLPLIFERFCQFESEASVIVARSIKGEIKTYEPLTNIHKNGILSRSFYPAKISNPQKITTQKIATKIAEKINLIGILAVEFFIFDNQILVNELAPRPHNSGHFSMDGAITSQFDQLIRCLIGDSLGNTKFHSQGQMINLIGDEIRDLEKYQKNPNAKIHLYGKKIAKDGRKMGHINLLK